MLTPIFQPMDLVTPDQPSQIVEITIQEDIPLEETMVLQTDTFIEMLLCLQTQRIPFQSMRPLVIHHVLMIWTQ